MSKLPNSYQATYRFISVPRVRISVGRCCRSLDITRTLLQSHVVSLPIQCHSYTEKTIQASINMLTKWEDLTGIPVEIDLLNDLQLYDKALSEATTKAGTWDFLGQRIDFLVDCRSPDVARGRAGIKSKYPPD